MKHLITLLIGIVIIQNLGCKKENTSAASESLNGKWKIARRFISTGGPGQWVEANSNDYIIFNSNGKVSGTVYPQFTRYVLKDSVTMTLKNADNSQYENYKYKIKDSLLNMSPAGPIMCTEGCTDQFVKLSK